MPQLEPVRLLVPEAFSKHVSRRAFLSGATALGATALLAACAPGTSGGGSSAGLNIYTWGEYDDPDVIKAFTTKDGTAITIDSYGSNPEMIAKLSASKGTSGYDICVPTHSAIQQMVTAGLLAELDHSKLPNMKNLTPAVLDTAFDPGNVYSVCKDWGSTGFVYDTSIIQRELTSWADFWDAAANEASGSFSLLEDQGEVSFAYFLANGIPMNTDDEADIAAYREFILGMAQHVQAFESYVSTTVAQDGRALAHCWNGDARLGILNNADPDKYKWVWPAEGGNLWQDNWAIVKGAPNEEAAYAFIDYILDPEVSLKELTYVGYNTGIEGIEEAATEAGVDRPDLIFISDEIMSKLEYSEMKDTDEEVIAIYNELKAAAGQ
ncbi:polyamine ABC transporter substrate-binding protein [Naasia lichenicola]|uniref:Spermidine/putrescine ABC transporter substrate-binding protein n=1 Tax=Naasia lichenicola TaxID=2565933 RepID=A0A4S4FRQ5_9MICO|nr:spermidine/putrescine ABC transporter substrate-binding protein [Naasia lichenicola]THG33349.1 spermidine/putrescine ABC transporter substrate-binding protein [Naasia lichenicola]